MIHPTAIISEKAKLHPSVKVGPYAVIKGSVVIGEGTRVGSHAIVGHENIEAIIGKNNIICDHSFLGGAPQDLSYKGEVSKLIVGDGNTFREFCTINTGTLKQDNTTTIGNNCLLMAYVHIGHDCILGDRVIVANTTNFAGHVKVGNNVTIGGACNFSQFVSVGDGSYITGESAVNKNILPYVIAQGKYAVCRATNKIGLERSGISSEDRDNIHKAIRTLLNKERTLEESIEKVKNDCRQDKYVKNILNFIASSDKGLAR